MESDLALELAGHPQQINPTNNAESAFRPSEKTKSAPPYYYQPLATDDSIRMVELLPGSSDDTIKILLRHRVLSDMPKCSAISYMWGDVSRVRDVMCGGKTIKVTSSALLCLKKLRKSESRLIWIDGISINQDDLAERSQQVPLMKDIYQLAKTVLIWIGDETKYTKEAFEAAKDLSRGYDYIRSTKKIEDNGFRQFKTTADIPELSELELLTKEPWWEGVVDAFSSRNYFRRLWVVQEIVLSTNASVVCGRHQIPLETFYKAAACISYCHFLQARMRNYLILADIKLIGETKYSEEPRLFPVLLARFSHKQAYEPRDRVFAILGMLSSGSQDKLLQVDYTKPVEKVFQDATAYNIIHYKTLDHWVRLSFDPVARSKYNMPSWVEMFTAHSTRFTAKYPPNLMQALRIGNRQILIEDDILTVYAIIIDTISASLPNFSNDNFKALILEIFGFCFSAEEDARRSEKEKVVKAAQKTLRVVNPYEVDRFRNEEAFFELLSKWMLSDLGINHSVVHANPKLKELSEAHPKVKEAYSEEIQSDMTLQDAVEKDEALKWMLEQTVVDNGPEYEKSLKFEVLDEALGIGRSFFLGKMGYCGVGPAGKCDAEGSQAAVQIWDVLALVYGAPIPMILRSQEVGTYTVVGSCHVGNLGEIKSPVFKDGKLPEPVALKIR